MITFRWTAGAGGLLLHLVNYDVGRAPVLGHYRFSEPDGVLASPHEAADGPASLAVPRLAAHQLATIQLEDGR